MLNVRPLDEVNAYLKKAFSAKRLNTELVPLKNLIGRVLACDIESFEYVPGFNRSTVDGYAVAAGDTFGASDAIPALFSLRREIAMGEKADFLIEAHECAAVPTGGEIPNGADCAVMVEHTEKIDGETVAVLRACAPGNNVIYKGDDTKPGDIIYKKGTRITDKDIGALAAIGCTRAAVYCRPKVAVISTGDELVEACETPSGSQIRDVNRPMIMAALSAGGFEPVDMGIYRDVYDPLRDTVAAAAAECDMVIMSGGTSVGTKDAASLIMQEIGRLLVHGIAIKPGKPTVVAEIGGTPVFALPGNPVAAYFLYKLTVEPLLQGFMSYTPKACTAKLPLSRTVSSNNGREEYVAVSIVDCCARPIAGKSGLITTLSSADGYICIPRDCEGLPAGEMVDVVLFER